MRVWVRLDPMCSDECASVGVSRSDKFPGAFEADDETWNAVREDDRTDSDDEGQGMRPETPPLLPLRLLAKWQESQKAEAEDEPPTEPAPTDNTSETEEPTNEEIGDQVAAAQTAQTEVAEADKKNNGVNARRKR